MKEGASVILLLSSPWGPLLYAPGFVHIDLKFLPQLPGQKKRRYLYVAIDRASRWVFHQTRPDKTAASARRFLRDLAKAAPFRITKILTDNGKEFTDRLFRPGRQYKPSGHHEFDQLCAALDIEHRLIKPRHP
ncbi:MAG: hypothetical protein CL946_00450 [Ectothiorhodospiraceae bacterium]|nr:hypothetical protein [Ectothiorhodospiraceae bacterium]